MKTKFIENAKIKVQEIAKSTIKKVTPIVKTEIKKATNKTVCSAYDSATKAIQIGGLILLGLYAMKPIAGAPTNSIGSLNTIPNVFYITYNETTNNYYKEVQ